MRVVAGEYGGRTLKTLNGRTTRPTTDKVRGAIFNMIGPYFEGGRVLDLYAGTGALAIEAISRGCEAAVLVERDSSAQQVILENIQMTKAKEKFQLLKMSAEQAVSQLTGNFDLVFLDPPYAQEKMSVDISALQARDLLSVGASVICETDKSVPLAEQMAGLTKKKEKIYGIIKITIYS